MIDKVPVTPTLPHVVKDEKTGRDTVLEGYYPDLNNEFYHKGPGFSSSNIKVVVNKSPRHLWDKKINPDQEPVEPVKAGSKMNILEFGNAFHCMVLESTKFHTEYVLSPVLPIGITSRMNKGKELLKAFSIKHAGKRVICEEDLALLEVMTESVRNHPRASKVLEVGKGIIEASFYHIDEETGVLVKIRPDYMRRGKYIADLKSTVDANNDGFSRHCHTYGYHISAAMYLEVFKAVTGEDYSGKFVFVAQEKERPYAIASYVISDEALALGADQYRKALRLIADCQDKYGENPWDSYPTEIQSIDLP
nr:PD-(D/E)XK nuclease-like domain-containing protein [Bacteroidales bacterium]